VVEPRNGKDITGETIGNDAFGGGVWGNLKERGEEGQTTHIKGQVTKVNGESSTESGSKKKPGNGY